MKKMLELPKKAWPIAVILAISLLASWRWIGISIFSNGDWSFHFSESLKGLVSLNFPWTASSNLGSINLTASSWPSMFLFGISGFLNQNSNVADKFVFMFPVILLPGITSYVLLKKILNSTPAALAGSLVFTYNTYFLILKTSQLTVLVAEFLAPLLILLFIKSLEERKVFNIVATSLLALLIGAYEFRILYVIGAVLFFYFTFHLFIIEKGRYKSNLKSLAIAFFTLLIVGFLNSYWIIGLSK